MERGELTESDVPRKRRSAVGYFAMAVVSALAGFAAWWLLSGAGETAPRGKLRIVAVDERAPKVDAESAASAERTKEQLDREASQAKSDDLRITAALDAPRDFHVHLFDEAGGRAVANAALYVSHYPPDALPNTTTDWGEVPALHVHSGTGLKPVTEGARATAKSDDDGRAVVDVPKGRVVLVDVLATGYAPVHFEAAIDRGSRERPLEVGLSRTASLHGTVHAPDGQPLGGLRLRVSFDRRGQLRPRPVFGTPFDPAHAQCEAVTTASGEFAFTALPADVELLLAAGADEKEKQKWRQYLWLDPGESRELRWFLSRRASVSGRVVGADGSPIVGATVNVVSFEPESGTVEPTDERGEFRVESLPAGDVLLQVAAYDGRHAATSLALKLADGEARTGVSVWLADAATLRVRATDPEGREVLPSEVRVFPTPIWLYGRNTFREAGPELDSARVSHVPLGDVFVRVRPPLASPWSAVETSFHHDGQNACEVQFTAGGTLGGTLVDAANREVPVAATATVLRRVESRRFWDAQSMESMIVPGTFEFGGLAEGTYDVLAQSSDGRVGVASEIALGPGERRDKIVVELAPGATLELVAPKSAPSPIRFEARRSGAFVGAAFAPVLGRTHLTVPPGRVTIEAIAAGVTIGTREVEAKPGEVVRVRF